MPYVWKSYLIILCPLLLFRTSLVAQTVKNPPECRRPGFDPWVGKIPWRRERLPIPILWPGESHGLYGVTKSRTWLSDFHFPTEETWLRSPCGGTKTPCATKPVCCDKDLRPDATKWLKNERNTGAPGRLPLGETSWVHGEDKQPQIVDVFIEGGQGWQK